MSKVVVELTDDDLALTASVMRTRGRALKHSCIHVQGDQCTRIAEALCNARPLPEGACHCCGKGSATLLPCVECGVLLCQDCTPPIGCHVCDIE